MVAVYVTTMTLTTVGYGDVTADNTSERVGFTVLFIAGAFVWGNLLAALGDIHASTNNKKQAQMEKVQTTLDFLTGTTLAVVHDSRHTCTFAQSPMLACMHLAA